jgi:hypothetical protein
VADSHASGLLPGVREDGIRSSPGERPIIPSCFPFVLLRPGKSLSYAPQPRQATTQEASGTRPRPRTPTSLPLTNTERSDQAKVRQLGAPVRRTLSRSTICSNEPLSILAIPRSEKNVPLVEVADVASPSPGPGRYRQGVPAAVGHRASVVDSPCVVNQRSCLDLSDSHRHDPQSGSLFPTGFRETNSLEDNECTFNPVAIRFPHCETGQRPATTMRWEVLLHGPGRMQAGATLQRRHGEGRR